MYIDHIAIWVHDLEGMKQFYKAYFHGTASKKYMNISKQFESYFITFNKGCRLELMHKPGLKSMPDICDNNSAGYTHIAFSLGTREKVDALTDKLRSNGYIIFEGPRITGDGYYECVFLDPEGNRVEIFA